ncbi:helix-turn-helix transcriptional regulator [Pseudoflavonifractor sp. DSM 107456]|uniref:Helix-turn-helix transcriptional regulator n=2 Tax=Pseudoflavonifractor TaxID=1017280 RepID=A0ABR9RDE1_9FIRM|nr:MULTISPECIES: PadR family transcriptional regulator [Eubacteriales]MBC5730687.1 helix-turn-helix transcriptional regulator [Pseudoflavonifractor hominis]MBE5056734.1 helix-turn-helix transcriptional regulator [Pseudoflavonifractor gallinarum]MBS5135895.1 helix-turn-helix transcriptional regulator [Oscillospiraceae bacterium]
MKPDKNLLSGSTTLLVLSLLASGDKYGYEMIAALEEKSDHTFTLREGTLYPILHGLEREGAVTAYEKEAPSGRKRRYYHITRTGLTLLGEKREEWRTFRHLVDAIVAEGEGSLSPA